MRLYYYIILIFVRFLFTSNNHPIFLIHGFLGWGRDEMNGYYYWGGKNDFQTDLREAGFDVYSLSVGPVSSNWDRATEAYAQIKGGCVDYGKAHSNEFGIIQKPKGKCYDGYYPKWDENHPIHLIGHSQGGQTARMLEHLLVNLYSEEESKLYYENKGWIKSITTLSTPHDGATLTPIIGDIFPLAQTLASWVGLLDSEFISEFYNFDLEQWGLSKKAGENNKEFWTRVNISDIRDSKNFSSWDLSLKGSQDFNSIFVTNKETFYFTFASSATSEKENSTQHTPDSEMRWLLKPVEFVIGKSKEADEKWYRNNGIVNTISMYAPSTGINGPAPAMKYNGNPQKSIWQNIETLHMDHHRVIGGHVPESESSEVFKIYYKHCSLLYSL